MANHTKVFRPVSFHPHSTNTTIVNEANFKDSDLSTYGTFNTTSTSAQYIDIIYDFTSLKSGGTLTSATLLNDTVKLGFSGSGYKYFYLQYLSNGTQSTSWLYNSATTRFYYNSSTSKSGVSFTHNKTGINIATVSSSVPITYSTLASGNLSLSLGIVRTILANDLPLTVVYSLPDYTVNFKAGTGGTVDKSSLSGDAETSTTVTATPSSGYKFKSWSDGNTSATRTFYADGNITYTATFEPTKATYKFCDKDGNVLKTATVDPNTSVTPPASSTVARSGYEFVGWIPSDNGILCDSYKYTGVSADAHTISRNYMYTDKISIHIEAKSTDWQEFKSSVLQIISCAESGGWDLGADATFGGSNPGFEIYDNGKTSGSHYRGVGLSFTSLSNEDWHTFDCVYDGDKITVWLDGISKGSSDSFTNKTLKYHASNAIFVGAEAGSSATSPNGKYFKGLISNVFIENTSERLVVRNGSFTLDASRTFYPVYRILAEDKKPEIHSVSINPNPSSTGQGFIISVSLS